MKSQYNITIHPHSFNEGYMFLTYEQKHDKLGAGKFKSMWHGPSLSVMFWKREHMSYSIMMGYLCFSPAMGSTLKDTMPRSSNIGYL